jgi:hypothetical protein
METFIVLVKLLCAHLCSDFIFQTDGINEGKSKSGIKGIGYQLLHSVVHACAAYLFVADWSCWFIPVAIFVSHLVIDMIKCKLFRKRSLCVFLLDQLCHIAVIVVLCYILFGDGIEWICLENLLSVKVWVTIIAYLLILRPSSIFLGLFLDRWTPASPNTQSLPNAGQWIGYIERILILTFVLIGSFEGVGFLLAAKSVFRFGELSKAKEIRTTEYVLIGTLASFAIAVLIGIAVSHILYE